MAALHSVGIPKPAGLSYLIAEGLLSPTSSNYTWTCTGEPGDELLTAGSRVIWTRHDTVHHVYNFQVEKEQVVQALFATFPRQSQIEDENDTIGITENPAKHNDSRVDRAVVVLLKTQAHVFIVGGSTHVLSLPFEVQQAFSTPYGVILQRAQLAKPLTISFQDSKTPYNSFAASQHHSASSPESWKALKSSQEPDPFYAALSKHQPKPRSQPKQNDLPHHVYLREPLTEIGIVGEVSEKQQSANKKTIYSQFSRLRPNEEIIYMSRESEIFDRKLLLAVTRNLTTSQCTIWKLVQTPDRVSLHRPSSDRFSRSRRRSSHGPGTGTTTPGVRASINPRESFGGLDEGRKSVRSRKPKTDAELASQLDAAFEGSTAVSQSNRRISSLLARSDLTTGNDAIGLTDPTSHGGKRGPSFGGPGAKASFNRTSTSFGRRSGRFSQYGVDMHDILNKDHIGSMMDTDSDTDEDDFPPFPKVSRSLQQDIAFVKIHSFTLSAETEKQFSSTGSSKPAVVVLRAASSALEGKSSLLAVYVHDPTIKKVACTNLDIAMDPEIPSSDAIHTSQIRVRSTETLNDILGICRTGIYPSAVCIMLTTLANGEPKLVKHTVWSQPISLTLPSSLLRRNPFRINIIDMLHNRREGGLKRVLSDGIDRISGLRSTSSVHQFDIEDSKGTWHRLELHSGPKDPFIEKLLKVCEVVMAGAKYESRPVFRLWDLISHWLHTTQPGTDNITWKTFLVLISTVFATYLPVPTKPVRSKRKTGLLRSSSGAQIDTESFDCMMLSEDKFGASSPAWLQHVSWRWATETIIPTVSSKEHKSPMLKRINLLPDMLQLAREFINTYAGQTAFSKDGFFPTSTSPSEQKHSCLTWLLAALHLICEDEKLDILKAEHVKALTPVLAQIGGWLGCSDWDWKESGFYYNDCTELDRWNFDEAVIDPLLANRPLIPPPSIFAFVENVLHGTTSATCPSLRDLPIFASQSVAEAVMEELTPRTSMVIKILEMRDLDTVQTLSRVEQLGLTREKLETFPEGIIASIQSIMIRCHANPPSIISNSTLSLIDRGDLVMLEDSKISSKPQIRLNEHTRHEAMRDYHHATSSTLPEVAEIGPYDEAAEMDRQSVTRLIFSQDQRFIEATRLVHPLKSSTALCIPEPEWSEQQLLDAQQELAKVVAFRTLSVSPGRAMLFYNARHPLLTEKFPIHGFTLSTIMKPSNNTVAADRTAYTEDRVSWAFFHAGVEAGLTISKGAKGIDTSWILFNKPKDLGDRHAGLLLALGLNGHLRTIAKWVAFKYLTPKHTMTSIGLLLGLAASHLGSMDPLITRLLSVHVTRLLPPGASELNLSPLTQTTGIMALGLLYHNSQHRRMSEIMLSEIECIDQEEGTNPMEDLRDEGYRLAAGFALGYINLGQGRKTKGLNDMKIVERLLSLVVATRKVSLVHILDKATAGATIALGLIFMKTGDQALANKIDVPSTRQQFEYIRPDIFLLRTLARHLIMWDGITPTTAWIKASVPGTFRNSINLGNIRALQTDDLPLYNIITGLCLAIGLRFAGSARLDVRDLLVGYLDQFIRINKLPAALYDGKLTRITTRNCQDVIVLASAAVMAGTGDIVLFRRFRSLHGRTTADTPYGSHLAAHQAIGLLFLAGGTYTLGTSNLAVASLICSFYPLFPSNVQDNKAHLQAFRHFWVFAADPRCLVIRNADTMKSTSMKIVINLKTGKHLNLLAPCLLPELDSIARIQSDDSQYWPVVLDFENNPKHIASFRQHQSMFIRRRGPYDAHSNVFSATMQTLNDRQKFQHMHRQAFEWVFNLPSLSFLDQAERALVLPANATSLSNASGSQTTVDDRLTLEYESLSSLRSERLWNLRVLFAWAAYISRNNGDMAWLGKDIIETLRAKILLIAERHD